MNVFPGVGERFPSKEITLVQRYSPKGFIITEARRYFLVGKRVG